MGLGWLQGGWAARDFSPSLLSCLFLSSFIIPHPFYFHSPLSLCLFTGLFPMLSHSLLCCCLPVCLFSLSSLSSSNFVYFLL